MTSLLTLKEVLERPEDDICEEEDSDFKEGGIYGYMAVDNALSLAALCSEGVLNVGKKMT